MAGTDGLLTSSPPLLTASLPTAITAITATSASRYLRGHDEALLIHGWLHPRAFASSAGLRYSPEASNRRKRLVYSLTPTACLQM